MKKVLWLLAIAITTAPVRQAAQAREWVISPDGSDKATGTAAEPFQTISRGAAKAQPGDTILVRAGVYRERVTPPRGGVDGQTDHLSRGGAGAGIHQGFRGMETRLATAQGIGLLRRS
jgi:hypothetical protein